MSSDDGRISPEELADSIRVVDVAELAAWDRSPVDYDVGMVTVQAGVFGQLQPAIVHQETVLFDGGELDAERVDPKNGGRLAVFDLPASWSRAKAEAAALALLTRHRQGLWDNAGLAELVAELHTDAPELAEAAGWDGDALDELIASLDFEGEPDLVDDPGTSEPPPTPVTETGDVWLLGPHRLICGDSTDPIVVAAATAGVVVDLVHADPPYGMGKENEGVANDNLYGPKLDAFQMAWWAACRPMLADNGSAYIWGNAPGLWRLWYVGGLGDSERLSLRNEIVWDKGSVLGMSAEAHRMYPTVTERCLFFMLGEQKQSTNADEYWEGWEPIRSYLHESRTAAGWDVPTMKSIAGHSDKRRDHWTSKSQWEMPTREVYEAFQDAAEDGVDAFKREYDDIKREYDDIKREYDDIHAEWLSLRAPFDNIHDNMTDVWTYQRVAGEDRHGHATPKPVEMMERILKSSTTIDGGVLCPFGGTGPELIAAERTGRKYYGVELKPEYCDVICARYQAATGTKPVLESTGRPHDFTRWLCPGRGSCRTSNTYPYLGGQIGSPPHRQTWGLSGSNQGRTGCRACKVKPHVRRPPQPGCCLWLLNACRRTQWPTRLIPPKPWHQTPPSPLRPKRPPP